MKKFAAGTLVVGAVLSLALASALAQTIRRAENLPEPVAEDQRVDVSELDAKLADANVVLLDVREPWELEKFGTREGYINIPIAELADRLDELPKEKTILTA
jgi:predicted sulfurtransferase